LFMEGESELSASIETTHLGGEAGVEWVCNSLTRGEGGIEID